MSIVLNLKSNKTRELKATPTGNIILTLGYCYIIVYDFLEPITSNPCYNKLLSKIISIILLIVLNRNKSILKE